MRGESHTSPRGAASEQRPRDALPDAFISATPSTILADRALASFSQNRRLLNGGLDDPRRRHPTIFTSASASAWPGADALSLPQSMVSCTTAHCGETSGRAGATEVSEMTSTAAVAQPYCPSLTAEDDEGDVEYKWRLTDVSAARFQHLVTQMQYRVAEGRGQCLYELGVSDDGTPRGLTRADFLGSVQTIQRMADALQLEATMLQCCIVATHPTELLCAELMVSRRQSNGGSAHDLSVAFCGAVGSGKSTLMAVLLTSTLDDGRGGTRQSLFNHKHELDSGKTSSLATRVWTVEEERPAAYEEEAMGGMSNESVSVATPGLPPPPTPPFTCSAPRSITLLDAGGDITKTMLFGLMSRKPDYVCVCVAADAVEVSDVALYARLCCAMATPFMVVVTKCDLVEEFELDGTLMELAVVLDGLGCSTDVVDTLAMTDLYCKKWLPMHREMAVDGFPSSIPTAPTGDEHSTGRVRVPLFCVSSVEGGGGLDRFRGCVAHLQSPPASLPATPPSCLSKSPFEVLLDYAFEVKGVGPVVHGRVAQGPVEVGCCCYMGPGDDGRFYAVSVKGIHVDGAHVNAAQVGDEATFALDWAPPSVVVSRKGKVLVRQPERVSRRFAALVCLLSQNLAPHMEPIMYARNTRQAVTIISVTAVSTKDNEEEGGDGSIEAVDTATVLRLECQFLFRPEVIALGDSVVLQWAPRGIAIGKITDTDACVYDASNSDTHPCS